MTQSTVPERRLRALLTAFLLAKLNLCYKRTNFSRVGPILAVKNGPGGTIFDAKIGPPGPILGGTDFAVTAPSLTFGFEY